MTTYEFLNGYVSPVSHKIAHDYTEYDRIRKRPDVLAVKATTLYQIYKHNVFGSDDRLPMRDFFQVAAQYFYYDKYVCHHGTEFFYHVVFNEDNPMYRLTKDVVDRRVRLNRPEALKDLVHKVEAMTKED
jgi:hypothetical protein